MEKKTSSSVKRSIREISTSKTKPVASLRAPRDEAKAAAAEDPSSRLVGRIVEKGFSSSTSFSDQNKPSSVPRPTVLPFPVARHRSHGPHWAPITSEEMDVDDDNDNGDKDETDFCPLASFANPPERKPKKTLNFSRWKELIAEGGSVEPQATKLNNLTKGERLEHEGAGVQTDHVDKRDKDDQVLQNLNEFSCEQVSKGLHVTSSVHQNNGRDNEMGDSRLVVPSVDLLDKNADDSNIFTAQGNIKHGSTLLQDVTLGNFQAEHGSIPLEREIDAENRARLQQMSPVEIAEAQAEIMEKMNPGLLEVLKKRGQKKLGKIKNAISDVEMSNVETKCDESHLNQESRRDPPSKESKSLHVSKLEPSSSVNIVPGGVDGKASGTLFKNLWSAWSKRVEAARTIRFSLDGTVLESNSDKIPDNDNTSDRVQHDVETVTERDYLRTEGDPAANGYTIKEAVALCRSTVPGQRALALQLLTSVLDKASHELKLGQVELNTRSASKIDKVVDWEAVWAYTLGPEPELSLSVRMALDDNHISVVLACVKAVRTILCCDMVEQFFDISEKLGIYQKDLYTAPVFRGRPGIDSGFLHGGFWKYSTKPSNIMPSSDKMVDAEGEGKHTIQDDIFMAGQDIVAGLIRMGILPRICYLLEADPTAALEEYLISILVGLARHSPTGAYAIIRCPGLVQTIVDRFITKETMEIHSSKIKAVTLLKVLAQSDKKSCTSFIENGIFRIMMWHFYQQPVSLDQWIKSGREHCKLMSGLMIEQLRLWKVCIHYGYCISYFSEFFPFLCMWLSPPTIDILVENNVLAEFTSITREVYLVLGVLARRLPNLHSEQQLQRQSETWSWSHVSPMVESALKWISLKINPSLSNFIDGHKSSNTKFAVQDSSMGCFLWVISAVMHMLSSILKKVASEGGNNLHGSGRLPWLPEFVPRIGLEIIKNKFLNFPNANNLLPSGRSFVKYLCDLRLNDDYETSLSSVCCLHGLVQLIAALDKSIQMARQKTYSPRSEENSFSREAKILEDGIFRWSVDEFRSILVTSMTSILLAWPIVQSVEKFGRGGPAPGTGPGWGVSGGGFWSSTVLLGQTEAHLLMELCTRFPVVIEKDNSAIENMVFTLQNVNSVLGASLTAGPRDTIVMEEAFDFFVQSSVLKNLDLGIRSFLPSRGIKTFGWEYREEDYLFFSEILKSHFTSRWLSVKKKSKPLDDIPDSDNRVLKKSSNALETIHEDMDTLDVTVCGPDCTSLVAEWAHQRLPLPTHWFLSPISTFGPKGTAFNLPNDISNADGVLELAKSGLFFLLGLEAMSNFACTAEQHSPVHGVPLVWKLHSLSIVLLVAMGVLQEEKSRDVYRALQDLYGQLLDESKCRRKIKPSLDKNESLLEHRKKYEAEDLKFQTEIHESYTTFIETLVEHFGADSYSDVIYGRQVAIYLHFSVETPVRLATWNALSSSHSLELLPPLGNCFAEVEGYLGIEDNEGMLEAYAKSWVSGALDKAASRGSMSFTLALHHLSSFFFDNNSSDKSVLRNKLAKSLLRDYSRKQQHEVMILELIHYNKAMTSQKHDWRESSLVRTSEIERRFGLLTEACEGNSAILATVEKLKSSAQGR